MLRAHQQRDGQDDGDEKDQIAGKIDQLGGGADAELVEQPLAERDQDHGDRLLPQPPVRRVDMEHVAQNQAGE